MFDRILVVDWSAANAPRTGADAIWIADSHAPGAPRNVPTRTEAMCLIRAALREATAERQTFVGLDFAFGYPKGSDALPGGGAWEAVWSWLDANVVDGQTNASNRFECARRLNEPFGGAGPFWGYPHQHHGRYGALPFRRPDYAALGVRERRHVDTLARAASPPWKLSGNGSVGGQALLGIARLEGLRAEFGRAVAVWPFQTRFADDLAAPVVVAEIYPSLWERDRTLHAVKDAQQVETLLRGFTRYRDAGRFEALLDGPRRQPSGVREAALTHEAWMVGFADAPLPLRPDA